MRVGLIDVDGHNYPNLALMKISAYHKAAGDEVEWYVPFAERYDVVYKSKVFSFTPDHAEVINADKVIKGGTGYAIKMADGEERFDKLADIALPQEIERIRPDYSLYGITNTAYGFLTRGCPRGCNFCIVGNKEGRVSTKVANVSDFWKGEKNIVIMDPNILASKDCNDLLDDLAATRATVDFNQGLDIRLMTETKAQKLGEIKTKKLRFAWDRYEDKDIILKKLREVGEWYPKKTRPNNSIVYVIVNFDTTLEQDLERIYTLRDMGYWAYVMVYDMQHCAPIYKDLQRWCNNRVIFKTVPRFEDYKR